MTSGFAISFSEILLISWVVLESVDFAVYLGVLDHKLFQFSFYPHLTNFRIRIVICLKNV
jgi:hypothetical protein